uniref:Uncharacterized protein n=1 Tax=Panagrolaimus davidi TaxID=227884 RepID=A0A914P8E3_9BILA
MAETISRKRNAQYEEVDSSGAKRRLVVKESVQIESRSSQVEDLKKRSKQCNGIKVGIMIVNDEKSLLALKGDVAVGAILPASNANSWHAVEMLLFGNSTASDTSSQMKKSDSGQKRLKSEAHKHAESNVPAAANANVDKRPSSICSAETEIERADVTPVIFSMISSAEKDKVAEVQT